ncbi:MAG: GMC family oxidoreductase [Acidobacteria bacterium]|nr:GMC family oxidoreductase [Acidobacteriota bacterium]
MNRRKFLVSLGAAAGTATLLQPQTKGKAFDVPSRKLYRRTLSSPFSNLQGEYDVVIVGSGYGGGITAARLAGRGKSVCVLERGKEYRGGVNSDFPFKSDLELSHGLNSPLAPTGLYDVRHGKDLDVLVGCGLGGTSLINANVMYLPEAALFEGENWPAEITRDALGPYYDRARGVLRAEPYGLPLPLKAQLLKSAAGGVGEWKLVPIAVTTRDHPEGASTEMAGCVGCASCVTGCNFSAKNTIDMTYLPLAQAAGAELFTRVRVQHVAPDSAGGRYVLHYEAHDEEGRKRHGQVKARVLVLSAGSLGSTEILLRSRAEHNLEVSPALGSQFSGNGDFLGFAYNTALDAGIATGPTIVSSVELWDSPDLGRHVILEEGAIPVGMLDPVAQLMAAFKGLQKSTAERSTKQKLEDWHRTTRDLLGFHKDGALSHSLCFLGMGHDSAGGRIVIDKLFNHAVADYPHYAKEPCFQHIDGAMEKITTALGGVYLKNPMGNEILWQRLTTVHPLGGCAMDGRSGERVVNHYGEVHGNRNLFVMDGAIIPTAMGVNPAFTISALAERTAEHLQQRLTQLG